MPPRRHPRPFGLLLPLAAAFAVAGCRAADPVQPGTGRTPSPEGVYAMAPPLRIEIVSFEPLRLWHSARTGARYPVVWRVRVAEHTYLVEPLMDDQELDSRRSTGAVYWEGAVRLRAADGTAGSAELGQG